MKALVYEKYAENNDFESILQLKEVPDPVPKPNEVLFRVKAAALNYDDIWGMRGKPLAVPLPHISGTCLLYTSPSPRDKRQSRMPSSA